MIKYNLKCENKHEFESWFSESKEFDRLKNKNLIEIYLLFSISFFQCFLHNEIYFSLPPISI